MQLSLIIGVSATVLGLGGWLVGTILLRRHDRATAARLSGPDRDAVLRSVSLHEQATAGQMASMASAQRQ